VATLLALASTGGCACSPEEVFAALGSFAKRLTGLGLKRDALLVAAVFP
jgi:hypothetical protein